ncbi:MAG: pyridoxamine 5'-phosphate oxidase [Planctomycetota bacterium]
MSSDAASGPYRGDELKIDGAAGNADLSEAYAVDQLLPEPLPTGSGEGGPMGLFKAWFDEAHTRKVQPNPHAMTLCTVDPGGTPSARIVLCKGIELDPGAIVFYSNRASRKGRALEANPHASLVFHWDALDRQVRIEGPVTLVSDVESDAYFQSRKVGSRVGAWSSDQSEPIESRAAMIEKVERTVEELGVDLTKDDADGQHVPRPAHWGGYRVWARAIEFWVGGPGRVHDRARWTRELTSSGDGFGANAWSATRLQP